MDVSNINSINNINNNVSKMKKQKNIKTDECLDCGHEKRYHANPQEHILKTSHCTKQLEDNTFCKCKKYSEVKQ